MRLAQQLPRILSAVGINAVPAAGFFAAGWSPELTMLLFLCENVTNALLTALRVRILSPPERKRRELLTSFLMVSLGFTGVSAVFATFFIFAILDSTVRSEMLLFGLAGIAAFQLFGFIYDLVTLRPLPLPHAEKLLEQSLGRVLLLAGSVFIGVVAALWVDDWFVVPFIVLKTIVDVAGQIEFFRARMRGRLETPSTAPGSPADRTPRDARPRGRSGR